MRIEKIFDYDGENLTEKTSFSEGEKGSFGEFNQDHGLEDYLIFAKDQTDFENKNSEGAVEDHRFHSFLMNTLKLNFDRGCMTGGKQGEYEFKENTLFIKPYYKMINPGEYDQMGENLMKIPSFNVKRYKLLEGLYNLSD